jgi:hypothetical protein
VLTFIAGGVIDKVSDPTIIVGANNTHLYFSSSVSTGGHLNTVPLPSEFAAPLILGYDPLGQPILGSVLACY